MTYNEGFLGEENSAYCSWILKPDKWGGAIELSILAAHYGREIAAYDIQTKRCDVYGQVCVVGVHVRVSVWVRGCGSVGGVAFVYE